MGSCPTDQLFIIVARVTPKLSTIDSQQWFWWPADPQQVALRAGDNLIWQRWLITYLEHRFSVHCVCIWYCSIKLWLGDAIVLLHQLPMCHWNSEKSKVDINFIKWKIVSSLLATSASGVVISTAKPPPASLIQIWYHLTQEQCFRKRDLQSSQEEAPEQGLHHGEDSWVGCHGAPDILVDTTYLPGFFYCQHCQHMAAHWSPT